MSRCALPTMRRTTVICAPNPVTKDDPKKPDKRNGKPGDQSGGGSGGSGGGGGARAAAASSRTSLVRPRQPLSCRAGGAARRGSPHLFRGCRPPVTAGQKCAGQLLAPLDPPLVEGVDAPGHTRDDGGALVERHKRSDAERAEVGSPDQGAGPVSGHRLVRNEGSDRFPTRGGPLRCVPEPVRLPVPAGSPAAGQPRSPLSIERTPMRSTGTRWVPWCSSWKKAC